MQHHTKLLSTPGYIDGNSGGEKVFLPLDSQKSIPSIFPEGSHSLDSCFMVPRLVQFPRHEVSCFTEVAYRWEFHSLHTTGARLHWSCRWFKIKSVCPNPLHRLALHTVLHVQQHICHIHCNSPAEQETHKHSCRDTEKDLATTEGN